MARAYKAILHGDRVEWIDPPPYRRDPTRISITLQEDSLSGHGARGDAMATALEAIARQGGISAIPDPCTWQREVREDRRLSHYLTCPDS